ncbi:concanavalin A-like lectin/glucanase domain-containing protein [Durotheca rogersii]|uniref:concanavalin A-like lectin/glucanase domain-containing protein n=1 Tax=Durotheca rogersii TaxID=419775 RepID=UPI00222007A3|nr:concanavalin A-like lectin/glucanase domain-containing protein [Durotheca rogersii]KAI5863214.1 concanavalin A-like lectin/glucanase domain-containing protein [Durotheca rogersii]
MISSAEVETRSSQYYGTFRAGIKITDVPGTCTSFFWYMNDTQEIDVEFLSSQFGKDNGTFPVSLVLRASTPGAASAGPDRARKTGSAFKKVHLPFDPTADFHEYRFDFLPDEVLFYADATLLAEMNQTSVPLGPGRLHISHWSNGNVGWSSSSHSPQLPPAPPATDAITTVSYVKAYFNASAEPSPDDDRQARCRDPAAASAVCAIPVNSPGFFFGRRR